MRDYVYVVDCAAKLMVLERGSGQVYHLGFGIGTSVNELFQQLQSIPGYTKPALNAPAKPGETFKIYLNANRASRELDWHPTIALEEGLKRPLHTFV